MKRAIREKLGAKQMQLLAFEARPRIVPPGWQECAVCKGLLMPISGGSFRHVTNAEARACAARLKRQR